MKFVANRLNKYLPRRLADDAIGKTSHVQAAIAYASDTPHLLDVCLKKKIKLDFWCRLDSSIPVHPDILKKFIDADSLNFSCRVVYKNYHPKVIWWHDYGVYIGSANLTDNGWMRNIEAGLFLEENEFIGTEVEEDLVTFFDEINARSHALTEELYQDIRGAYDEREKIREQERKFKPQFEKKIRIPKNRPLTDYDEKSSQDRRKEAFLYEWNETLQKLRAIGSRVSQDECRPIWVKEEVPVGVQADQFLHGYYYKFVIPERASIHEQLFEQNRGNPEKALISAMEWWKSTKEAPSNEDRTMYGNAVLIRNSLHKDKIMDLSEEEFAEVCANVHAMRNHARQMRSEKLDYDKNAENLGDARAIAFGKFLYQQRSKKGNTMLDMLYFILYGGDRKMLPDRIWEARKSDKYSIQHVGINGLGEIVGWAMPETFPPRNDRTSKALRALGEDVATYSGQ